jgi:hypothetical protein
MKCGLANLKTILNFKKNYMKRIFLIVTISTLVLSACEKNELRSTETISTEGKAFAKIALLSPNTPNVIIKQDGIKVNTNTFGSAGIYPSTVTFPDYISLNPTGQFQFSLPFVGTGNDSVVLFSAPMSLTAGKFNSMVVADTGVDRTLFNIVDEETSLPADSVYNVRFINALAKSPNMWIVRIDSNVTPVASVIRDTIIRDIPFKGASKFVQVPVYGKPLPGSTSIHAFVRYRMVNPIIGTSYAQLTPAQTTTMHRRNATIYGGGFASGSLSLSPFLSNLVINK